MFEQVTIEWGGKEYTVPPDRVMGLIAAIEEECKLFHLCQSGGPGNVRLARAYAAALRYAGAGATEEDVFRSLFSGGQQQVAAYVAGLVSMMVPPECMQAAEDGQKKRSADETERGG